MTFTDSHPQNSNPQNSEEQIVLPFQGPPNHVLAKVEREIAFCEENFLDVQIQHDVGDGWETINVMLANNFGVNFSYYRLGGNDEWSFVPIIELYTPNSTEEEMKPLLQILKNHIEEVWVNCGYDPNTTFLFVTSTIGKIHINKDSTDDELIFDMSHSERCKCDDCSVGITTIRCVYDTRHPQE